MHYTCVTALPLLPPTKLPTAFVSMLPAFARDEEEAEGSFESRRKLNEGQGDDVTRYTRCSNGCNCKKRHNARHAAAQAFKPPDPLQSSFYTFGLCLRILVPLALNESLFQIRKILRRWRRLGSNQVNHRLSWEGGAAKCWMVMVRVTSMIKNSPGAICPLDETLFRGQQQMWQRARVWP